MTAWLALSLTVGGKQYQRELGSNAYGEAEAMRRDLKTESWVGMKAQRTLAL